MRGSIIALWLDDPASQAQLAALAAKLPAGVDPTLPGDCHLTLAVLPDVDLIPVAAREALAESLEALAATLSPAWLNVTEVAQFSDDDEDGMAAVVAHVALPGLAAIREQALAACDAAGVAVGGYAEYRPHITLGYGPANLDLSALPAPDAAWASDRLCLALGPGRSVWQLTGAPKQRRITGGTKMPSATQSAELKAAPHYVKAINGRTVTGIFSVFGNRDSYDDIIYAGSFLKTIRERGSKILHLWQHDTDEPPIARVESLREIGRAELPQSVQLEYPDATGGCEVTRTYLETPRANEVFTNLKAEVPLQMSFMFEMVKWESIEDDESNWGYTRHIRELRLWETSDVNWGANPATIASKRAGMLGLDLAGIDRALTSYKAGQRHSAADVALINSIHQSIVDLGCTVCAGQPASDDAKAQAAHYAVKLLGILDDPSITLDDPNLAPLVVRLSRTAMAIDLTPSTSTEGESRAAEPTALTLSATVAQQYQNRARLAKARLALQQQK